MFGLGNLFRRKRAPDPDQWQVGDQAECIIPGPWFRGGVHPNAGPQLGETRIVRAVVEGPHCITGEPTTFLGFSRYSGHFDSSGFRKVRPRADKATAAEGEFSALVRRRPAHAPRQPEEIG